MIRVDYKYLTIDLEWKHYAIEFEDPAKARRFMLGIRRKPYHMLECYACENQYEYEMIGNIDLVKINLHKELKK